MQLPNEQGVSKGGMQSHFGMRIRHDFVIIYLPGALFNRCFYSYAQTICLSIIANIEQSPSRISYVVFERLDLYLNNNPGSTLNYCKLFDLNLTFLCSPKLSKNLI